MSKHVHKDIVKIPTTCQSLSVQDYAHPRKQAVVSGVSSANNYSFNKLFNRLFTAYQQNP